MAETRKLINRIKALRKSADEKTGLLFDEIISTLENRKYGLYFCEERKKEKVIEECESRVPTLILDETKTIINDGEDNILIEGDNYHSLKVLNSFNKNGIDVIYIDPPYNEKNYDVMYRDSFVNYDGSRHDNWLSFMEKRIRLAHSLLKEDGVMFISIDESEVANLKLLCNEIFGEDNFLVNMVVINSVNGIQYSDGFAKQHSYCLCYQKSPSFKVNLLCLDEEDIRRKYNYGEDEAGPYYIERLWKRGIGGRKEDAPTMHFEVWYKEDTGEILIDEEIKGKNKDEYIRIIPYHSKGVLGRWAWSREKMIKDRKQLIIRRSLGEYKLYKKVYASNEKGRRPQSIIDQRLGRTELGSKELNYIMGEKSFEYPKYSGLISYLINLHSNKDAVVLDFFAGSGTSGQAVLDLNHKDKGKRRFILCTNNENGICENVTYQRLRSVITGIRKDGSRYSEGRRGNLYYLRTAFKDETDDSDTVDEDIFEFLKKTKHKKKVPD
ncbi:MAG: site-specific DNA-methyltransferase [Erysipelotrichaceae bacterium]|nr:site-specific DNA-methyltransferase [Erysipelotrichaceae bacterium]